MKWHWKIRIYNNKGHYCIGQIATDCNLDLIDNIQDFYEGMTGCRMILEGMSEQPYDGVSELSHVFHCIWQDTPQ